MGKCGHDIFPRDNCLVSARKSHSSGVRGAYALIFLQAFRSRFPTFFSTMRLPLRLWDFFPQRVLPSIFFDNLQRNKCLKNPKGSLLSDFLALRLFKILIVFLEIFIKSPKGPPSISDILQQNGCYKISKSPPFYNFRHCEIFQNE